MGSKALSEYLEVRGYADAADWTRHRTGGLGRWKPDLVS